MQIQGKIQAVKHRRKRPPAAVPLSPALLDTDRAKGDNRAVGSRSAKQAATAGARQKSEKPCRKAGLLLCVSVPVRAMTGHTCSAALCVQRPFDRIADINRAKMAQERPGRLFTAWGEEDVCRKEKSACKGLQSLCGRPTLQKL